MNSTEGITSKTIFDAMRKLGPLPHSDTFPFSYAGMRIMEEPAPPPKLKLRQDLNVSDKFRREYDAWLLERFGHHESMLGRDAAFLMKDMGTVIVPYGMACVLSDLRA